MATMDTARHRAIQSLVAPRAGGSVADISIALWESLAAELGLIIGDGGFLPLYRRSVQLSATRFPSLSPAGEAAAPTGEKSRFASLRTSFEGRTCEDTSEASAALFNTFIDMLARLIGEALTLSILRSAWGDTPFELTDKEFSS